MIRKVLFLIGNIHFLIRKRPFGVYRCRYVGGVLSSGTTSPYIPLRSFSNDPPPSRSIHHRRRRRSHRLFGHDGSQERLPSLERFFDLPSSPLADRRLPVTLLRGSLRRFAQIGHCANNRTDLLGHPRRSRNEGLVWTRSGANLRE